MLANFIDNHDGQRFLYNHSAGGQTLLENALAMVLLYHGLPVVYYGTEQPALAGLADQRTAMFGLHRAGTPMYKFLARSTRSGARWASVPAVKTSPPKQRSCLR